MRVDRDAFLEDLMWRGAIRDRPHAEAAVQATLEAVAEQLAPADAAWIAEALPPSFTPMLTRRDRPTALDPRTLHSRIAAREGISLGLAIEHTRAVCEAIAGALDPERRSLLERRLAPAWAELFTIAPRAPAADLPRGTSPGRGHTLATGSPGSRQSLAEGRPPSAQTDSVVTSENPHADSKVSSAGTPPRADDLATGRPGADAPIAEAKDERSRH